MIRAECYSDDRVVEIKFDATPFFEACTEEDVIILAECGWGGDYPADAVADHFCDGSTERLFTYLSFEPKMGKNDPVGYECHVDEDSARAWLAANRPEIAHYLDYLDAKSEIEEEPLTLEQWRDLNKSADEPEEIGFGEHRPE